MVRRFGFFLLVVAACSATLSTIPAMGATDLFSDAQLAHPFHSDDVDVEILTGGDVRVWTYRIDADTLVLDERLAVDGAVVSTRVLANGIEIGRFSGALPDQDEATLGQLETGLSWALHDHAGFTARAHRAAEESTRRLAARAEAALAGEKGTLGPVDIDAEADAEADATPSNVLTGIYCLPACWDCYGQEVQVAVAAVGTAGACSATPYTLITGSACAAGAIATVYTALSAIPDCIDCARCWLCLEGQAWACDPENGEGDGEGDGWQPTDPGACPEGTHPASPSSCGGQVPCCCQDEPPFTCSVGS